MNSPDGHLDQNRSSAKAVRPHGRLLIVEPDDLIRWSITTYLSDWFEVYSTDSSDQAESLLRERSMTALVLSDELSEQAADRLRDRARDRSPNVRIVHTVAECTVKTPDGIAYACIEKPFELRRLAEILGVTEAELARCR